MTISKAYSYLERDGVVERRPGRPLVVKALETDRIHANKLQQLRVCLRATVTIIHQLGIPKQEAMRVLDEMLGEHRASEQEKES